jgi:F-type H+-transporting ATPase subunit a
VLSLAVSAVYAQDHSWYIFIVLNSHKNREIMEGHATYLTPFIADGNWQKFFAAIALGSVLVLVGKMITRRVSASSADGSHLIPDQKLTLPGVFEVFMEQFVAFHDSVVGKEGRKYVPLSMSIFLFIFIANMLALVPGMPAITTTVWVNVAMALIVFVYFNWEGIKANGVLGYLMHFTGGVIGKDKPKNILVYVPMIALALLIFSIEILSTGLRIVTLNLRLYWNISADHIMLGTFSEMAPQILPVVLYGLGTFIAFIQAFVFTLLSMIYIMLAVQHSDEH